MKMLIPIRGRPFWLLAALVSLTLAACGTIAIELEKDRTASPPAARPTQTEAVEPYPVPASTSLTDPDPGTVHGAICYPGEHIPAMTAYFENTETGEVIELPIAENQAAYSVFLEPGAYFAFAYLPGGQLGGMYSEAVVCGLGAECTDHTPVVVALESGGQQVGVDLCDWYAQEDLPPIPRREPLAGLIYAQPFGGSLYQVDETGFHRPVTEAPRAKISPDGTSFLFERDEDLWIHDLTSGEIRNLTDTPDRIEIDGMWWPARPDTIVFGSWDRAEALAMSTGYLSMIARDGSGYRVLETEVPANASPAPGPDGETIAYDRGGEAFLYRLDTGPEPFEVTAYGLDPGKGLKIGSPAWSPDGQYLAWWAGGGFAEDGNWALALAVFDLAARSVQQVHTYAPVGGSGGWLPNPIWSPSGAWLAATTRGESERVNLWLVGADGREKLPLGRAESPVWRPDGRALVFTRWKQRDGTFQDTEVLAVEIGSWAETPLDLPPDSFPQAWSPVRLAVQEGAAPWFSPTIQFATGPNPASAQRVFPFGTRQIYAIWSYADMVEGLVVRREWVLDGGIWQVREEPWDFDRYGASGTVQDISIFDFETQLSPGTYRLRLYIEGVEQTIQEDAPAGSFTIAPPNDLTAVTSPDGEWTALVEPPGTLLLQDAGGGRTTLLEATEISSLTWFPDSVHLLVGVRDRSEQRFEAGPVGLQESLWVVNAATGGEHLISEAAGNMRNPLISPDGRYVAGVGGVGFSDACFVDSTLWIIELDDQKRPVFSYYQLDFAGLPEAGSAYVVQLLEWGSDTTLDASLGWTCVQEDLSDTYRLDLDARTAERLD